MSGRIPDSFIEELLARSDIVELTKTRRQRVPGVLPVSRRENPFFYRQP